MKTVVFFIASLLFSFTHSQNYIDIAEISYTNTPNNQFEKSEDQTNVEEFAFELNYPVKLNSKTYLVTSVFANKTRTKLNPKAQVTDLNVIGMSLGLNKVFNTKWSGTFLFFPKLAADKISFSSGNFQLGFLGLLTNTKRASLKYRYGFYLNQEKFGFMAVPILGVYYLSPSNKFEMNLNLPFFADANYNIGKKTWLGMNFDGLGTTFNLNSTHYSTNGNYVYKGSNELLAYFRYGLSNSVFLNVKAGYAISRNYEVYESSDKVSWALSSIYFGDNRTQLNERFKDGYLFKVEMFYRFNLN